ncbi:hypothetical protein [Streptomyces sp. NPDC048332]
MKIAKYWNAVVAAVVAFRPRKFVLRERPDSELSSVTDLGREQY